MTLSATSSPEESGHVPDNYNAFLTALRENFAAASMGAGPLFTTATPNLYDVFLMSLPPERRPEHVCRTCKRFVDTYGGLVTIDDLGKAHPVLFGGTMPKDYQEAAATVHAVVAKAMVTGVFLTPKPLWGEALAGGFPHMAVQPHPAMVYKPPALMNADQKIAERAQEYQMLRRSLSDFSKAHVTTAHRLLADGALYRAEKCLDAAKWLLDLHTALDGLRGPAHANLVWRAAATAPAGWAHVRSGVIGTLLEDIAAGMDVAEVVRRFNAKMGPLQYQRAQVPPKEGNVAQATKIVAALLSARALERRFAGLADIRPIWAPKPLQPPPAGGVFDGLSRKAKASPASGLAGDPPPVRMAWERFERVVLPEAITIAVLIPGGRATFFAFVTAADPAAPPVLQWDHAEDRNPVSWYTHIGGTYAQNWGLVSGEYARCVALTLFPPQWTGGLSSQGAGALFVIEGAQDGGYSTGAGFFTESLRSEYHAVRSTLEAHVARSSIAPIEGQVAAGLTVHPGQPGTLQVRVTRADKTVSVYQIDRWES